MQNKPDKELERQAQELAEMLDSLIASGTQHIELGIGEETVVKTMNSTDCSGKPGACAIPNFEDEEDTSGMERTDQ